MTEVTIFEVALEKATPAERTAYLDEACVGDPVLRQRVEALLRANEAAGDFLNKPAVAQMGAGDLLSDEGTEAIISSAEANAAAGHPVAGAPGYGEPNQAETRAEPRAASAEAPSLDFLAPARRPGALGRLGHYEILEVLGKGGFGIVFKAFDEKLHRVVAIKVLGPAFSNSGPARQRFLREARAAAAVRHEHIIDIHGVDEQPLPYLVMECVAGQTLQEKLDETGPLEVKEILRIGQQIARGLAAAHKQGLIHRDIKPGNILLENAIEHVKITDFGLARAVDDASVTQSGVVAGTPMYMSPEQAEGVAVDHRSDLFSLGTVLYVMCTGRPPFRASGTMAVLRRVIDETPRPIREINTEIPQWLCDIVEKLHAKKPEERFQSAKEVADLLAKYLSEIQMHGGVILGEPVEERKTPNAAPSTAPRHQADRLKQGLSGAVLWLGGGIAVALILLAWAAANRLPKRGDHKPPDNPVPVPVADTDGWAQLFNGKDLTGWKTHPDQPGDWKVKDGILIGRSPQSHLFSEGNDFQDFHLRAEAKINDGGDSGIWFRAPFALKKTGGRGPEGGYEAELHKNPSHPQKTGSIFGLAPVMHDSFIKANEWVTLEIIAEKNRFVTKVNGKQAVDCEDSFHRYTSGHLALQCFGSQTLVEFRKIEIKELPTTASPPLAVAPFDAAKAKAHQDAWAKHLGVDAEITNSIGMKLRLIPPGEFMMGTSQAEVERLSERLKRERTWFQKYALDRLAAETPQHRVAITRPFYLGAHEVTVGQFRQFIEATGHQTDAEKDPRGGYGWANGQWEWKPGWSWRNPGFPQTDEHPVGNMSWDDAQAFCRWLSAKENVPYRLPTEAEWEYACRAGSATRFHGGDDEESLRPLGNIADASLQQKDPSVSWACAWNDGYPFTAPVGRFKPNALGLYDMHGNVSEWCADWYDPEADYRVFRGGGWDNAPIFCRSADRYSSHPYKLRTNSAGLRVALVGNLKATTPPAEQWVQLFNGKDKAGWKPHPDQPDNWRVEEGLLVGSAPVGSSPAAVSHLFSERGDYEDFHLRAEARINFRGKKGVYFGNSGIYFRVPFALQHLGRFPTGYEAQIFAGDVDVWGSKEPNRTGSLYNLKVYKTIVPGADAGEWFIMEVIARGNLITIKVNGVTTVDDFEDSSFKRGHFALQQLGAETVVHFRKIEIKELTAP